MKPKTPHNQKKVMSVKKRKLYNNALFAVSNLSTHLAEKKDVDMYKSDRALHALWEIEE